jgi:hypothetical protein
LRVWLAVLACAAVYGAAGWYLSAPRTFWSSDNAVRFVQLESIRRNGYRSLAAVYPAEDLDPEHGFFPIAEGFSYRRDGRTYLSYPWLFPLLAAPLYGALGFPGCWCCQRPEGWPRRLWWAGRWGGPARRGGVAAALLVGAASPLVVYAAVFWDHTVVAALGAGAVALLLGAGERGRGWRQGFWAGFLLGLGPHFRNETYVFAVAVAVGLVASESSWRFRVVEDRTPMVVEFGGVRELRLVTYQGSPRLCLCGAGNGSGRAPCSGEPTSPTFPVPRVVKKGAELRSFRWKPKGPESRLRAPAGGGKVAGQGWPR